MSKTPDWHQRLSVARRRSYDKSATVRHLRLRGSSQLLRATAALPAALARENRPHVQALSQQIVDEVCAGLGVRRASVTIEGVRPSNAKGELHGLYTTFHGGRHDSIKVWMRTAKQARVVAFKTFLRTLLHELCHHLDYTLLGLEDSFHTDGFFQRESSLFQCVSRPSAQGSSGERKPAGGQSLSDYVAAFLRARQDQATAGGAGRGAGRRRAASDERSL